MAACGLEQRQSPLGTQEANLQESYMGIDLGVEGRHRVLQPEPNSCFLNRGSARGLVGYSRERQCGETTEEVTRKVSADISCRVTDIWNVLSRRVTGWRSS